MEVALLRSPARRRWPAPFLLASVVVALAAPSAAQADNQFCYGKVTPIDVTEERDTGATYEFSCREAIKGFAVSTSAPLVSFDVAADVFDGSAAGGALRNDDRFGECEGDLPGLGFTCAGSYTAQGHVVRATFDGLSSPCARDESRHVVMSTSLVVVSPSGKLSGPFDLGRTTGCPKPAKKAKKAKRKRS
jgi:hypothetical protein